MMKKIMKTLYFILIIIVTFITISFSEVNKLEQFLKKKEHVSVANNHELIQNLLITKNNRYPISYIYNDPILKENYTLKDKDNEIFYSFDLYFYKYIESTKRNKNNGLAIILKNLEIYDENKTLLDNQQPVIDIDISYDQPLESNNENHFATIYPHNTFVLLINYDMLIVDDVYVNIKDITFKYETKGSVFKNLITLKNEDLSNATIKDDLGDVNRDLKVIETEKIIKENINIDEIKNDNNYINNKTLKKDLNKENIIYVKYVFIELLFIIPITYFIFFHKDLMDIRRLRKKEQKQNIEEIKKKLLEESEKEKK